MDVQLINKELLEELHSRARESERLRQNFDLRTTPEDTSQRMLNVLELGTHVPIHRHLKTSETVVCLEGCLDWVFFAEQSGGAERYEEFSRLAGGLNRPMSRLGQTCEHDGSCCSDGSNERPEVERPNMDAGGPVHDGEVAADESCFVETARFRVCPREGQYGIQVPLGAWHSVVVHEASTILEAKDGAYGK